MSEDICRALHDAVVQAIPDAQVKATGGGGHYRLVVVSPVFAGKNTLQKQRLVYKAIGPLMHGDSAPVHAIDALETRVPEGP